MLSLGYTEAAPPMPHTPPMGAIGGSAINAIGGGGGGTNGPPWHAHRQAWWRIGDQTDLGGACQYGPS